MGALSTQTIQNNHSFRFHFINSFDLDRHRIVHQTVEFFNRICCQKLFQNDFREKSSYLGLLEEDDEFEEFPAEEWDAKQEDQTDVNVWEDNWDDDAIEDDFSIQLRSELENQGMKMES